MPKLKDFKIEFRQGVLDQISARELTSEKLKNTSVMKMNVPKFRGYESPQDIYTFKSEFQRKVSPTCRNSVLPNYLKTNYLSGQALAVVKEIDDIDRIWERLIESFGNVDILLNSSFVEFLRE